MGGCFSVSLSCDQVVNQVSQSLCNKNSYIHNIEKNLKALETTMEELMARRNDLLRRVEREENRGLRRLDEIQVWLSKVESIESQVNDLLSVRLKELQRLCLCGFCSKNLMLSYRYGKQVFMKLEEVENLKSKGVFEVVAEQAQAYVVVERPIQPTIIGHQFVLETAWNHFNNHGVGMLGLHGMGGVGKTTLLKQINNKIKENIFDVVIWVVVSKDLQIQEIQEEVAKKLGLNDSKDWNKKTEDEKACDIHSILRRKKFVLFLDDIWAKVDLTKIGVPFPNRENGSKVVFTTRSQEVCGRMRVDVQMEVQCLSPEDALDLFQKTVGEITLGFHPDIPELAKVVAQKCRGLPLALKVIGEAMSCKQTIQEWHHAIDVLTHANAAELSEIEDEILPILKYSYDNLKSDQVKSCLLYCSLFPEDEKISKDALIEYLICEGIIDDSKSMHMAKNKGYEIIGNLVRSSLLMEEDKLNVYMHDVVREMALWIGSDFGKQKDNFIVNAGAGLYKMPKLKNCDVVKRISLMANKIDHISGSLECLQLKTLFLQRNSIILGNISGEFFNSMPRLVVLDLSSNTLTGLPEGISKLVSLKYLNLSSTKIQSLPVGLQRLKNLIHLDLEWTHQLSTIVGISAQLNLRVLKLFYSGVAYSSNALEELKVLENLEILTICIYHDSGLDEFLSSHKLMCCTQVLKIWGCQLESSHIWRLASMEKVCELRLDECTISEIEMNTTSISRRETVSPVQNPNSAFFLSLSRVSLLYSKCPKELTWLMFARNLIELSIRGNNQLEEIINKEKACEGTTSGIVLFQKLEYLKLAELPELKNIYWRSLPFPCLKKLYVNTCPKLRKLPFNSKSGLSGEEGLVIEYDERKWFEELEWEDEATKARF